MYGLPYSVLHVTEMRAPCFADMFTLNVIWHLYCHILVLQVSRRFLEEEHRYNYTTPKSFLELIEFYKELLRVKRGELDSNILRLANGLKTLRKTNEDVQVSKVPVISLLVSPSSCQFSFAVSRYAV